jgi:hypothetical protein
MPTEDANRPARPERVLSYATLPLAIATTLFLLFIIYVFNAVYTSDTRDEPLSGFLLLPPLIACVAGWSAYALAENDHPIGTRAAVAQEDQGQPGDNPHGPHGWSAQAAELWASSISRRVPKPLAPLPT